GDPSLAARHLRADRRGRTHKGPSPMSLSKITLVAQTEFGSAVRTRSFLIGVLFLPLMMVGSILIQISANRIDQRPRAFAVVDHAGGFVPPIAARAEARNALVAGGPGPALGPRFDLVPLSSVGRPLDDVRLELSDRIRDGELHAFVEIPANVVTTAAG